MTSNVCLGRVASEIGRDEVLLSATRVLSALGLAAHQFSVVVHQTGPSDQVALDLLAIFASEKLALLLGFDTFSNDREMQAAPKTDHGPNDSGGLWIAMKVGNKCLIDLDLIERERLKVRK